MDEHLRILLGFLLLSSSFHGLLADVNVIKAATLRFGEALEHCRVESGLTEKMMEEFYHFWSDDFQFERRELGCAIQCMSRYYNLLTDSSRMHHTNTEDFLKSVPNGDMLAKKTVSMIHECEKKFDHEDDHCMRILHIAECFKKTCKEEGLAPSMEVMIAEFIMEAEG